MIDTLLANLDRFDVAGDRRAPRPPGALRGRDDPPARERGRSRERRTRRGHAAGGRGPGAARPAAAPPGPARPRAPPASPSDERLRVIEPLGYVDVPLARPRRRGGGDGLGRHPGGDDHAGRPVPHGPPQHGAARSRSPMAPTAWWSPRRSRRWSPPCSSDGPGRPAEGPPLWDGHAGERIAAVLRSGWAPGATSRRRDRGAPPVPGDGRVRVLGRTLCPHRRRRSRCHRCHCRRDAHDRPPRL